MAIGVGSLNGWNTCFIINQLSVDVIFPSSALCRQTGWISSGDNRDRWMKWQKNANVISSNIKMGFEWKCSKQIYKETTGKMHSLLFSFRLHPSIHSISFPSRFCVTFRSQCDSTIFHFVRNTSASNASNTRNIANIVRDKMCRRLA